MTRRVSQALMCRPRALLIVATLAGCALAAAASAAQAAPTWLSPVSLSPAGQGSADAQVLMDQNAQSLVVWDGPEHRVWLARRLTGGAFGSPVALSDAGGVASEPQISDIANDDVVVWERDGVVQAATLGYDEAPAAAIDLSAAGADAHHPQLAAAYDGQVVVAWERTDGANSIVQATLKANPGAFAAPVDLSAAGQDALDPHVSNVFGDMIAVWRRFDGTNWRIQGSMRARHGSFATPVDLSAAGGDAREPRIVSDFYGNAFAVWRRFDGAHWIVQAAVRPPSDISAPPAAFSSPVDLSAAGQDAFDPAIVLDTSGRVTVVWRAAVAGGNVVEAVTRPQSGAFSTPVDLSAPAPNAFAPQVSSSYSGHAVVVWHRFDGTRNVVQAARRADGGSFSAPVDVSEAGEDAVDPHVASSGNEDATAVWLRNGTDKVVRAAGLDVAGPFLFFDLFMQLSGGSGVVGTQVQFQRPAAFDAWSAVGSTTWSFGDGSGATTAGPSVAHTYARPGTYAVKIAVADALGNTTIPVSDDRVVIAAAPGSAPPPPPPLPAAAPTVALTHLRLSPATLRAARSGPAVTAAAARRTSTVVRYDLNLKSTVRFTLMRSMPGRRASGGCASPAKANRSAKACTRWVRVAGSFTRKRPAGADRFSFTGRVAGHRLRVGRYRLVAEAVTGGHGSSAFVGLRVVR
jgi:hypothetical protein